MMLHPTPCSYCVISFQVDFVFLQVGHSWLSRCPLAQHASVSSPCLQVLHHSLHYMESFMKCLEMNWMTILVREYCSKVVDSFCLFLFYAVYNICSYFYFYTKGEVRLWVHSFRDCTINSIISWSLNQICILFAFLSHFFHSFRA